MDNNKENTLKELPKYFVIKKDESNPLWQKYINWINSKIQPYNCRGIMYTYYGVEGEESISSVKGFNCSDSINDFQNNPTLITLEQWDSIVNPKEFVLPEKWCIKVGRNSTPIEVYNWRCSLSDSSGYNWYDEGFIKSDSSRDGYRGQHVEEKPLTHTEITFDQFKQYVLKQTDKMEDNKELIGYKCPTNLFGGKIAKDVLYVKIIYKKTNQYAPAGAQVSTYDLPEEIVETWEPVYKSKYELPEINGYKGIIENNQIVYGCAKFNKSYFGNVIREIELFNRKIKDEVSGNRPIKSITLDSNVTITIDQLKQIVDYINNNK